MDVEIIAMLVKGKNHIILLGAGNITKKIKHVFTKDVFYTEMHRKIVLRNIKKTQSAKFAEKITLLH
jgi:hypothetical protein